MGCRAGKGAGLVRIVSDRSRIIGDLRGMVGGRNTGIGITGAAPNGRVTASSPSGTGTGDRHVAGPKLLTVEKRSSPSGLPVA
jgi:hypothetical protein